MTSWDYNTWGTIIGGSLGVLGGVAGTYCSIRSTTNRSERRFMIWAAVSIWLGVAAYVASTFLASDSARAVLIVAYPLTLIGWTGYIRRRHDRIQRRFETGAGSVSRSTLLPPAGSDGGL